MHQPCYVYSVKKLIAGEKACLCQIRNNQNGWNALFFLFQANIHSICLKKLPNTIIKSTINENEADETVYEKRLCTKEKFSKNKKH